MEKTAATREGAAGSGASGSAPLALIAAGGEGRRLGASGPKALVACAGRPLLAWCLDAFAASAGFGQGAGLVVVAAHRSELAAFERVCAEARAGGLDVILTEGGTSRSHSVAAALQAGLERLAARPPIVLVHDAARIFTSAALIDALHDGLAAEPDAVDALIAARPVTDTIKLVDETGVVRETPPRELLWAVQTPQAFRARPLSDALGVTAVADAAALDVATDDASLVEARGGTVKLLEWTAPNEKITTPDDLERAERRLRTSGD
jgi:2-C-methyl-D-erythritol 4-phosphate cytidylyltransferase